jgi:hypothetical protein
MALTDRRCPSRVAVLGWRVRVVHSAPDSELGVPTGGPRYIAGGCGQKGFETIQNLRGSNEFKSFQTLIDLKGPSRTQKN